MRVAPVWILSEESGKPLLQLFCDVPFPGKLSILRVLARLITFFRFCAYDFSKFRKLFRFPLLAYLLSYPLIPNCVE